MKTSSSRPKRRQKSTSQTTIQNAQTHVHKDRKQKLVKLRAGKQEKNVAQPIHPLNQV